VERIGDVIPVVLGGIKREVRAVREEQPDGHMLTATREYGRVWIGCKHGVPRSGCHPTRICIECFRRVVRG
jgi:hypothetical protein